MSRKFTMPGLLEINEDPPRGHLQTPMPQTIDADRPMDETPPSLDEVRNVVARLMDGKKPGVGNFGIDLLKAGV